MAGWEARGRAALEEFERTVPRREQPPGFGGAVLDEKGKPRLDENGRVIRSYPLGHQGRFLRLGDAKLRGGEEIAELVAKAVPGVPGAHCRVHSDVRREIAKFIK